MLRRLADEFARSPHRFEFFQAVRLLQRMQRVAVRHAKASTSEVATQATLSNGQLDSLVRFRGWPSFEFPASEIAETNPLDAKALVGERPFENVELTVSFFGLFGPSGVLPRHYTQLLIERVRKKDHALRNFLDLFNHQLIAMFYDAWSKYRLPIVFERHALEAERRQDDKVTRSLFSLVGLGIPELRQRLPYHDHAVLYYGGHFSHAPRNGVTLEAMVQDFFGLPTKLQQLYGRWLYLRVQDQSRLGGGRRNNWNNQLGSDVVVGRRVWGVENSFRLRLGPLSYAKFQELMPDGTKLSALEQFVTSYVGPSFDFDVQLVLQRDEVPGTRLAHRRQPAASRLGWNTWIYNQRLANDCDDAVFVPRGDRPTSLASSS